MDDEYKIIDTREISIPFNLEINDKEVTHTIIQGTVGTGMSSAIMTVLDSYVRECITNSISKNEISMLQQKAQNYDELITLINKQNKR